MGGIRIAEINNFVGGKLSISGEFSDFSYGIDSNVIKLSHILL